MTETIDLNTDYQLEVTLVGTTATLFADDVQKATFDFGEPLTDGQVGVGTRRALSQFDNLTVLAAPASANTVPEPSSLLLALFALTGVVGRRE